METSGVLRQNNYKTYNKSINQEITQRIPINYPSVRKLEGKLNVGVRTDFTRLHKSFAVILEHQNAEVYVIAQLFGYRVAMSYLIQTLDITNHQTQHVAECFLSCF